MCVPRMLYENRMRIFVIIYLNIIHFMLSVRYKVIHQRLLRTVRVMLNETAMCLN